MSEEYPNLVPIRNTRVLLRTGQWLCDPSTGAIQRVGESNGRAPRAQCSCLPPQASPLVCSCRQREPRTCRCLSEAMYRASASKSVSQKSEPQRELLPKVFGTTICVCASNALELQRNSRNSGQSSIPVGVAASDGPRRKSECHTRPFSVAIAVLCRALPEAPVGLL